MNNSGCHGNQSKKPLKIFSSQTAYWIAFFFLQECSSDRGLQNSLKKKKKDPSKNMAFMGDSFSFYGIK